MRLAKLAVASLSPTVGAVRSNVTRAIDVANQMAAENVTIGAFPEQVIGGYPPEDLVQWPGFLIGQRHALEMLARSDRAGCALGAAMALVLDWRAIRSVLDAAAKRFSVDAPVCLLPNADETGEAAAALVDHPRVERALMFGAQQILIQQRGLWDLLESRQQARKDY